MVLEWEKYVSVSSFVIFTPSKSSTMKKNTSLAMHLLFSIIVIVELLGRLLDNIRMEYFVKPLIMIWIAVFFLLFARKGTFTIPVLLAFFFSWPASCTSYFPG